MTPIRLVAGPFLLGLFLLAPLSLPLLAQTPAAPTGNTAAPAHAGHAKAGQRGMHRGMRRHGGLERLDTDHDGRISRAEFDAGQARRAAMLQKHGKRTGMARRQPIDFAAIDTNHDGYLVRTELRAHHEQMRPQMEAARKARFEAKFAEADLNRDGKLSRVEVAEKMPRMAERFAWMDDNRDGFLSHAELQAQHGKR
jgi:Ca2+-binding EF-hand superfamily protein